MCQDGISEGPSGWAIRRVTFCLRPRRLNGERWRSRLPAASLRARFRPPASSLSKGLATEYQMSDRERLIAVEPGDFRGESVFSP